MVLKICGITRASDARHAVEQGATAIGFVFWRASPRYVTPERAAAIIDAIPRPVATVGVFVNASVDRIHEVVARSGIDTVQLHGDEPASYAASLGCAVFKTATLATAEEVWREWPAETTLLLDAADPVRRGGTGVTLDWVRAAALACRRRVLLAGGLTPANVAEAIETVRPAGVDVSSGVEEAPGLKSAERVAEFLANARSAFERL
jgi:phosphoribosylanthranilate isomerase